MDGAMNSRILQESFKESWKKSSRIPELYVTQIQPSETEVKWIRFKWIQPNLMTFKKCVRINFKTGFFWFFSILSGFFWTVSLWLKLNEFDLNEFNRIKSEIGIKLTNWILIHLSFIGILRKFSGFLRILRDSQKIFGIFWDSCEFWYE